MFSVFDLFSVFNMHPSFRHVFGGEETATESPPIVFHVSSHCSGFQIRGQFQPTKDLLSDLYGKCYHREYMVSVITENLLSDLYGKCYHRESPIWPIW